jgi:putative transferase (TIGR04331 family)
LIDSKSEWFEETNIVFQQVLDQVALNLNEIHSVDFSTRYWNIFVGPWLQQFVDMVMFRMFDIESNTEIPTTNLEYSPANSLKQFHQHSKLTDFVERLHHEVLFNDQSNKNFSSTEKPAKINSLIALPRKKLGRSFVSATYLPRKTEAVLQLRLGRLPRRIKSQNVPVSMGDSEFRRFLSNINETKSVRAQTIIALLPKYMPRIYVEHYTELIRTKKPWNSKRYPKVIFTANRHLYDDVFNYWTALAAESGSRIVLAQHGGQFGISEYPSFSERHELEISNQYLTWGWKSSDNCYPGFALTVNNAKKIKPQKLGNLLVVTDELWKYPRSVFTDLSDNSGYLEHLANTISFLHPDIQTEVLLRIHHAESQSGVPQRQWWLTQLPNIAHDNGKLSFHQMLSKSRLVLIAHNGTSIPESLALHAPTIITWSDSYMKVRKSAKAVFDALEATGVFHRTPESAASFINLIWNDVDGWWNSPATIEARKQFTDQYARTVPNPVRFLAKALQF